MVELMESACAGWLSAPGSCVGRGGYSEKPAELGSPLFDNGLDLCLFCVFGCIVQAFVPIGSPVVPKDVVWVEIARAVRGPGREDRTAAVTIWRSTMYFRAEQTALMVRQLANEYV